MRVSLMLAFVAATLLSSPTVHAQSAAATAAAPAADSAAWQAWVERVVAIIELDNQRFNAAMPQMSAIKNSLSSPEKIRAQLPTLRSLVANMRADLLRSGAELESLRASAPPPPRQSETGMAEQVVADALGQNKSAVRALDAAERLFAAAAAGDRAGIETHFPALAQSSLLLIDGQSAIYRARRDAMVDSPADHAAMGLMATLYASMADLLRINIMSSPSQSADISVPRRNLAVHAANARMLAASGQAELTRRRATFEALSGSRLSAVETVNLAQAKRVTDGYGQVFAFGTDLASEIAGIDAALGSGTPAAAEVRQSISRLVAMEQKAISVMVAATGE